MDDTRPIILTVTSSVHIDPFEWACRFIAPNGGGRTRASVLDDVRRTFDCDPDTGTVHKVGHVNDDGPAFPSPMHLATTGTMVVNIAVTDPE